MKQEQKYVLISGANRGLGWQTAKVLSERGWQVFLGTRDTSLNGSAVENFPGSGRWVGLDVSNSESIQKALDWLSLTIPKLDVLINNARCWSNDSHHTSTADG